MPEDAPRIRWWARAFCWLFGHDWQGIRREKSGLLKPGYAPQRTVFFGVCRRCGWAELL
jgi:hypothetical protein